MMPRVGLTGPIGSGKSYVAAKLRSRGISVYDSDSEAKRLVESNKDVREAITQLLGRQAYDEAGRYQRRWVADRVFQNGALLERVNAIVHPAVFYDFTAWAEERQARGEDIVFFESALLPSVKREYLKMLDCVVLVRASRACRMQRVMARDSATREKIRLRMASQPDDEAFAAIADYTLHNEEFSDIEGQIVKLLKLLHTI